MGVSGMCCEEHVDLPDPVNLSVLCSDCTFGSCVGCFCSLRNSLNCGLTQWRWSRYFWNYFLVMASEFGIGSQYTHS